LLQQESAIEILSGGFTMSNAGSLTRREHPAASNSLTVRLKINDEPEMLGQVTTVIGTFNASVAALDVVQEAVDGFTVWDVTINIDSPENGQLLVDALKSTAGCQVVNFSDRTFRAHLGGKIEVVGRNPVKTRDDLSMVYTPGVARVCRAIEADPAKVYSLTMKGTTILIVTDGSRILSLGNIGPKAGLPVMEGKAALFKQFGNVNAVPICLDVHQPDEIVSVVKAIAPAYGGINLEDIASPGCWEIERRLQAELDIPVFHDDQHGTAVVVLAATINAARLVKKQLRNLRVVVSGVGAAGMACSNLLLAAGVKHLTGFNRDGAVFRGRTDLNAEEEKLAQVSNPKNFRGTLREALKGADMFLGLSVAGVIDAQDLAFMRRDAIVFALANPEPEVNPEAAAPYVRVMATGGSEHPNQINNALVFPGIFRGALDCRVRDITQEMQVEAARSLAAVIPAGKLRADYIIPSVFNPAVHKAVADAVCRVAQRTGQAQRQPKHAR
jgi:malate dehydrogenase (oxaloacetate-decarboxylating)